MEKSRGRPGSGWTDVPTVYPSRRTAAINLWPRGLGESPSRPVRQADVREEVEAGRPLNLHALRIARKRIRDCSRSGDGPNQATPIGVSREWSPAVTIAGGLHGQRASLRSMASKGQEVRTAEDTQRTSRLHHQERIRRWTPWRRRFSTDAARQRMTLAFHQELHPAVQTGGLA